MSYGPRKSEGWETMATTEAASAAVKPYHHGDRRRALLEAAEKVLEREGPVGLSLRAVAREAGVSPAAPYHHFKDKTELLEAVAHGGWEALSEVITEARRSASDPRQAIGAIGLGYVKFARDNPALYRLMYDTSRNRISMPEHAHEEDSGYANVQGALIAAGADPNDELELQLATIASWCAVHGLAEMCNFKDFQDLKQAMGGDEAFLKGILRHFGTFQARGPKH